MSQFGFLLPEWPDIHEAATRVEALVLTDPRAAVFYARRALEIAIAWLYRCDTRLTRPYSDNLNALLQEPSFRAAVGQPVALKASYLKDQGNRAVHDRKPVSVNDATATARELHHFAYWFVRTYARGAKPDGSAAFDPAKLPKPAALAARATQEQLKQRDAELRARDAELAAAVASRSELDAELQALRAQVAAALAANAARPDTHDYKEDETRRRFIDLLLREAGWDPEAPNTREVAVTGMPDGRDGRADYVLWGDDGKPLAVVEAKATRHDARRGQEQARLYADCLERMTGQRPIVFCSNGYEHWLWDDTRYPARAVQGFYKKDELALLVQRRATRQALAGAPLATAIAERPYQHRAIRRIGAAFEDEARRRALVVMATGAGKTRTVIALSELLTRCNWAKRILFLADRTALVTQAAKAFKTHLPDASPVNLVTDRGAQGRVFVSTYPTMMGLIDEMDGGQRRFGPGHFDLIVVDEAHRSIYRKYAAIFAHFDALLVGLTATPRDEIDRNTYRLFDLESGVPPDVYGLDEAVREKWLVPMRGLSVPLRIQREGLRYDRLSEAERDD